MTLIKIALAALVFVFILRACNNFIDPAGVEPEMQSRWASAGAFNGSWDLTSQMYESPSGTARVRWHLNNLSGRDGKFHLTVKRPDGSIVKELADLTMGRGNRTGERIFKQAKQFYLEIESDIPWDVTVDVME